ncbi:unnamed protein product [Schistocephalus solidus]|uniref:Uncharacterized protein n=1 Tax=Schistocephalus solidus TaxID=70667 RepID=A0A183T912_SCHSO|nr:unnamed protein product [Schistocephalus solidus]
MERRATAFELIEKFGVVLITSQYVSDGPSLEFVGHLIDSNIIRDLPPTITLTPKFLSFTSKIQLHLFLAIGDFYRRYVHMVPMLFCRLSTFTR